MVRAHAGFLTASIGSLAFLCRLASPAAAAEGSDPLEACKAEAGKAPYVCYDHAQRAWIQPVGEITREGAPLKIIILNTDPDHIIAVARQVVDLPQVQSDLPQCQQVPKVETIFPEGEGRYTLEIDFDGECQGLADVPPTEFRVHVLGWEQSVAGGFIGSGHKDPQFSTYTRQVGNQTMTFVEEEPSDRENDARLGLGSFIHLYHEGAERWATGSLARNFLPTGFSFGLGIGEQNRTTYAVGPSWRFGDKGILSAGYSWAPVDRLPNGIRACPRSSDTCDPTLAITDPNRLLNLGQRTEGAWFVSLSYSFITMGSFFEDRFREAIKASGTPQAPPQPAPPASQDVTDDALEMTCEPEENAAGDEVTVTVTVARSTGGEALRLEMGEQFDALTDDERGDWEPCSDADDDNPARCYELASNEFDAGQPVEITFKLTSDVAAGTYNPLLTVSDTAEATCDVVVTEDP